MPMAQFLFKVLDKLEQVTMQSWRRQGKRIFTGAMSLWPEVPIALEGLYECHLA
jgi:hypothetical protein